MLQLTCWTSDEYYPRQTCKQTDDFSVCSRSWGRFASEQACCAAGGAFQDGCSKPVRLHACVLLLYACVLC